MEKIIEVTAEEYKNIIAIENNLTIELAAENHWNS